MYTTDMSTAVTSSFIPKHGPCLSDGVITVKDSSSTARVKTHCSATVSTQCCCVVLLDTGSPHSFLNAGVWQNMIGIGAAFIECRSATHRCDLGEALATPPLSSDNKNRPPQRPVSPQQSVYSCPCRLDMRRTRKRHAIRTTTGTRQLDVFGHTGVPYSSPAPF